MTQEQQYQTVQQWEEYEAWLRDEQAQRDYWQWLAQLQTQSKDENNGQIRTGNG